MRGRRVVWSLARLRRYQAVRLSWASPHTRGEQRSGRSRETIPPTPAAVWASTFAPERLSQHVLVEREVGDQALQSRILVLELADAAHLVDAEVPVALLPDVE